MADLISEEATLFAATRSCLVWGRMQSGHKAIMQWGLLQRYLTYSKGWLGQFSAKASGKGF